MKPVLEHLPPESNESFFVKAFDLAYFGTPWHYHPEFELVLILEGQGKKIIGNAVSEFKAGDISFIGPNLPHIYRNPEAYYEHNSSLRAKSVVIHFLESSIGKDFLSLPQSLKLKQLFIKGTQGIDLYGKTKEIIKQKMLRMLDCEGLTRLLLLLEILHLIAESKEVSLNSDKGIVGHNSLDIERMSKVFNHVLAHFDREISLKEVSGLIHMTPTSFCRFFKARTKRSFFSYLNDIRLNHAGQELRDSTHSIHDVCYSCGFSNLSNFNRQFRRKYAVSPKEYRQIKL